MYHAKLVKNASFIFVLCLCVMMMGCSEKKRIAELKQTNKELQAQVTKLQQDVAAAEEALNAKQLQIASLHASLSKMQASTTNAPSVAVKNASSQNIAGGSAAKSKTYQKPTAAKTVKKNYGN